MEEIVDEVRGGRLSDGAGNAYDEGTVFFYDLPRKEVQKREKDGFHRFGKPRQSIDVCHEYKHFFGYWIINRHHKRENASHGSGKFCIYGGISYNGADIYKKKRMAQVNKDGHVFTILDEIQAEYPELIKLVLATESMDSGEKQYWFDILPSMTDEQVDRLFDILETERRKLEELELKYQEEIKNLNEKHLIEWQEFQSQESRKKIKQAEAKDANGKDTEEILNMLNNL